MSTNDQPTTKYLSMIECPVVFPGDNAYGMSSRDMLPRAGVTPGLISRHVRVSDNRIVGVCIWANEPSCKRFFDDDWYGKAKSLWGEEYSIRLERIEDASAA